MLTPRASYFTFDYGFIFADYFMLLRDAVYGV